MPSDEVEQIILNKRQLGPITCLDCTATDIVSAHTLLGRDAQRQIKKNLTRRLVTAGGAEQVASQIRRARKVQAALQAKLQNSLLEEPIRAAIHQYKACLAAWAEGAELGDFRHPFLSLTIDDIPASATDLATLLQEDETGCQTGVIREAGGAAILWHSEEDYEDSPGQRFDKLRLFSFRAGGGHTAFGFIYPDLLPGPTYGWQADDYVQAVDTLHTRPVEFSDSILPNTLAWLSLYLGAQVSPGRLAASLGPFQGGYSLTSVSKNGGQVFVEKVDFANHQSTTSRLEDVPGKYLFQTNVIRDLSQPIGLEEKTSPESRAWNEKRMARTARLIRTIGKSKDTLGMIFRLLRSRLGGKSAYANRDVKSYLICRMSPTGTSIRVGAGAAMPGDELFTLEL